MGFDTCPASSCFNSANVKSATLPKLVISIVGDREGKRTGDELNKEGRGSESTRPVGDTVNSIIVEDDKQAVLG